MTILEGRGLEIGHSGHIAGLHCGKEVLQAVFVIGRIGSLVVGLQGVTDGQGRAWAGVRGVGRALVVLKPVVVLDVVAHGGVDDW